jgi:hypothetical protein
MVVFRWFSLVLIVVAVMLLGADLVGTLEKKAFVIRSLHDVLVLFNYNAKDAMVVSFPSQLLNLTVVIVDAPGWLTLATLAFFFAIISPSSKQVRPLPPAPPIVR